MRTAADLAALYGVIAIPQGLTETEAMTGLLANMPRIKAMQCLEQASAIGVALSDDPTTKADIMMAAGLEASDAIKSATRQHFMQQRAKTVQRFQP
jgi:hypothetical protein